MLAAAWEQRKLGEVVSFCRGQGVSKDELREDAPYRCVHYGNLYTEYGAVISKVKFGISAVPSSMVLSELGDVLIPGSDTTPTGLARASCILLSGVILGGDINILRPGPTIDGCFLSFTLNAHRVELLKRVKGTTVRHLQPSDLKPITLALPHSFTEQTMIAETLRDLDDLITLRQRELDRKTKGNQRHHPLAPR